MRARAAIVGVVAAAAAATAVPVLAGPEHDPPIDGAAVAGAPAIRLTPPARSFTIVAAGDVLTENAVLDAAQVSSGYDFARLLAPIAGIVGAADLGICHMELPVGSPGMPPANLGPSPIGGNRLRAPYDLVTSLAATGFDRCSTASNHSYDAGDAGIDSTLDGLDANGMSHTGTARTPDEADPLRSIVEVNGVRVAHLAYTQYSNTFLPGDPWRLNYQTSPEQVIADVHAVRDAGAEVVIVSLHLRIEMQYEPLPDVRAFVEQLTAAVPVDAVIQHGPHVIQPVEEVNGTPVFWSIGNLLSGMGPPASGRYSDPRTLDGLLASVRFTQTTPGRFTAVATPVLVCLDPSTRIVWPAAALGDPAAPTAVLQACIDRSRSVTG